MFFSITDSLHEIEPQELRPDVLTVGIVTCEELTEFGPGLGFDEDTIEASQKANHLFRTGLDVRDDYTFAELRIGKKRKWFWLFVRTTFRNASMQRTVTCPCSVPAGRSFQRSPSVSTCFHQSWLRFPRALPQGSRNPEWPPDNSL